MKNKSLLLAATALIVAAAPFAIAQTRNADDAEALQRELERKAVRIPAAPPTAEIRAGRRRTI